MKSKRLPKPQMQLDDMIVGLADAQRLIGKGETHVLMLVRTGFLKKVAPGRYRVADVAQAALKFRESEDRKSSLTAEAKRFQTARATAIEIQNAKQLGELISIDDVGQFIGWTLSVLCAELAGVAAASTRDVEVREIIAGNVGRAVMQCKARLEGMTADARAGRPLEMDKEDGDGGEDD